MKSRMLAAEPKAGNDPVPRRVMERDEARAFLANQSGAFAKVESHYAARTEFDDIDSNGPMFGIEFHNPSSCLYALALFSKHERGEGPFWRVLIFEGVTKNSPQHIAIVNAVSCHNGCNPNLIRWDEE